MTIDQHISKGYSEVENGVPRKPAYPHVFWLSISCKNPILKLARAGEQLTTVNWNRFERKGAVGIFGIGAMLPLHYCLGAVGIRSWKE